MLLDAWSQENWTGTSYWNFLDCCWWGNVINFNNIATYFLKSQECHFIIIGISRVADYIGNAKDIARVILALLLAGTIISLNTCFSDSWMLVTWMHKF